MHIDWPYKHHKVYSITGIEGGQSGQTFEPITPAFQLVISYQEVYFVRV